MANIVIERGKVNNVIMTISERVTLSSPIFLLQLTSKYNKSEERFLNVINKSSNQLRYDEFEIIETNTPDYLNGEVNVYTGEWTYKLYEASGSTLDISGTTLQVLETGMVIVIDENYK